MDDFSKVLNISKGDIIKILKFSTKEYIEKEVKVMSKYNYDDPRYANILVMSDNTYFVLIWGIGDRWKKVS